MQRFATREFELSQISEKYSEAGSVDLLSRQKVLADNEFRQFWIPKQGLFGTRNSCCGNHTAVLDFYKCLCINEIDRRHDMSAKVHLLASLLPLVRSNGAQRVFPDASVVRPRECQMPADFNSEALETLLKVSASQQISLIDFHNQNREALEFPDFPDSTFGLYSDFEDELLDSATSLWWDDSAAAKKRVEEKWLGWRDGFGRRRGNNEKKDVLNILSYECKTAFHQCYSALWIEMIPHLMIDQENREFSRTFHTLWHLDHRVAVPGHPRDIHLLHGLALGLHPAFGTLLTTATGSRLVGETVADPKNITAQSRFLHAGLVSLHWYAAARQSRCHGIS